MRYTVQTRTNSRVVTAPSHEAAVGCAVTETTRARADVCVIGARVTKYYQYTADTKVGKAVAVLVLHTADPFESETSITEDVAGVLGLQPRSLAYCCGVAAVQQPQWVFDTVSACLRYYELDPENATEQKTLLTALRVLIKYYKTHKQDTAVLESRVQELQCIQAEYVQYCNAVINGYIFKLDSQVFGTLTNSVFTVGHRVTTTDCREHPEYRNAVYVAHKDFNGGPETPLCILFYPGRVIRVLQGRVGYVSERVVSVVGYSRVLGEYRLPQDLEQASTELARVINQLGHEQLAFVAKHPELNRILGLGATPEQY